METLLIFPLNGNALEGADCLAKQYALRGFIDDDPSKQGKKKNGYPVFSRAQFSRDPKAKVLAVPGSPDTYLERKEIIQSLGISRRRFATVIHPNAHVSCHAQIGRNVLIMAGVVIGANAVIGDHVCILPNTVIHHDSHVGDWTLLGSHVTIAGRVTIGENCYLGSASSVRQDIRIGHGTMVGMASNVVRSLPSRSKVAGNPARSMT